MKNYMLRDVDDALWNKAKAIADAEGRTIRGVLIQLIKLYVEKKGLPA